MMMIKHLNITLILIFTGYTYVYSQNYDANYFPWKNAVNSKVSPDSVFNNIPDDNFEKVSALVITIQGTDTISQSMLNRFDKLTNVRELSVVSRHHISDGYMVPNQEVYKYNFRLIAKHFSKLAKLQNLYVTWADSLVMTDILKCNKIKRLCLSTRDPIPTDWHQLAGLEWLNISSMIFPEFKGLNKLEKLYLGVPYNRTKNDVDALIPSSIGELTNLTELMINGAFSEIPSTIGNLQKLNKLFINGHLKTLPESFGNLKVLTFFYLGITKQDKFLFPSSFGNLNNLSKFYISTDGELSGFTPFKKLLNLKKLILTCSNNKIPKEIFSLKNLQFLGLDNFTTGNIPSEISNLKSLEILSINLSKTDTVFLPVSLSKLSGLKSISILCNENNKTLFVKGMNVFTKFNHQFSLIIPNVDISNNFISLQNSDSLSYLVVDGKYYSGFQTEFKKMQQLTDLKIIRHKIYPPIITQEIDTIRNAKERQYQIFLRQEKLKYMQPEYEPSEQDLTNLQKLMPNTNITFIDSYSKVESGLWCCPEFEW